MQAAAAGLVVLTHRWPPRPLRDPPPLVELPRQAVAAMMRAGRRLRAVHAGREEVRAMRLLGAAVRAELDRSGGGGMYGDTSGFHERDMTAGWRASEQLPMGFRA